MPKYSASGLLLTIFNLQAFYFRSICKDDRFSNVKQVPRKYKMQWIGTW